MRKISWKNILNTNHINYGAFVTAYELAKRIGYPLFLWSDKIFSVETVSYIGWYLDDDGELTKDLKDDEPNLFV